MVSARRKKTHYVSAFLFASFKYLALKLHRDGTTKKSLNKAPPPNFPKVNKILHEREVLKQDPLLV